MTEQEIKEIQTKLKEAGFDPGAIDGDMGDKTIAAVKAFQKSKGLVSDGKPGRITKAALGMLDAPVASGGFDKKEERLKGLDPDLIRVVKRAWQIGGEFFVIEGVRTKERMWETWGQGRTVAQCAAKGVPAKYAKPGLPKVTWLSNPLMSNHRVKASGYGEAVDLGIYPLDWTNKSTPRWTELAGVMFRAASIENVKIRWGADWDNDGNYREKGETDSPHFELVK